jgi:hypothetical protein
MDDELQTIERFVVPYRGEFTRPLTSENEVWWSRSSIYDATAPVSANLLASQMHGNLTSPSQRWFSLRFRDEDMNTNQAAKEWIEDTEERLWQTLLESDFNNEAAEMYLDLVSFGTSCVMMEEKSDILDEWDGIDFTTVPMADIYFEPGADTMPLRVYRRLRYTSLQLRDRFGDNLPSAIAEAEDDVDRKYEVVFCVYPREDSEDADITKPLKPEARPYGYKYILHDGGEELEEGGYYHFPAMIIRWNKVAGARYGYSPAMIALSDILQLNTVVAQTSEARAKAIDPPYLTTERGIFGDLDLTPGGLTYVTDLDEIRALESASRFDQADAEIERLQQGIRSTFFIDKLELKDSPQMTAYEVQVRYERMLRLMAPTLGRLQKDFLDNVVENGVGILGRSGQLKEMPEELENADLDIEYTGPLPRAQKGEIAVGIDGWMNALSQRAEFFPEALDIVDVDQAERTRAELMGVPAKALKPQNEVDEMRQERADKQEAMEQSQMMQEAGKGMKAAGEGAAALEAVQ